MLYNNKGTLTIHSAQTFAILEACIEMLILVFGCK